MHLHTDCKSSCVSSESSPSITGSTTDEEECTSTISSTSSTDSLFSSGT